MFLSKTVLNWGKENWCPGSNGIPGVRKARSAKKRVETMMTELD